MPKQICKGRPGCPELVERGVCETCRTDGYAKENRPNAGERGYGPKWARYSRRRLKQHPQCEGLRIAIGGELVVNTHPGRKAGAVATDHIVPVEGEQDPLFWDPENHQSACDRCHSVKTAKYDGGFGRRKSNVGERRGERASAR